ncbi:MAG TPA: hypothetical protein VMH33_04855 [Solirubrobacterales bacterium]|nr:hypothetical protein [Solirubrobacterales bacterium]
MLRAITQQEAETMRSALKQIAGFYNPAKVRDGGQAAALTARETLESLGLLYEADARRGTPGDSTARS